MSTDAAATTQQQTGQSADQVTGAAAPPNQPDPFGQVTPNAGGQAGPATAATPSQGDGTASTSSPPSAALRESLVARGFVIPDSLASDEQIIESVLAMADDADSFRKSNEYVDFMARRAEFENWKKQQAASQSQQSEQKAADQNTMAVASNLAINGILKRSENGSWSGDPVYSQYIDALNQYDRSSASDRARLAANPNAFVEQLVSAQVGALNPKSEIEQLKQEVASLREENARSLVRRDIERHASDLFVNGDVNGELSPLGRIYDRIHASVQEKDPYKRHQIVMVELNEIRALIPQQQQQQQPSAVSPVQQQRSPQVQQPAQQPAQQPKQSFLSAASQNNGVNRMQPQPKDSDPPQPGGPVSMLRYPSFSEFMAKNAAFNQN